MKRFQKFKFLNFVKKFPDVKDRFGKFGDKKFFVDFNKYKTLKKILPKKITIFDVGSNIGQTIIDVSKYFPKSSIHCFEPVEECQEKLIYLKNNLNSLNINLNFNAVGDQNKKKHFIKI